MHIGIFTILYEAVDLDHISKFTMPPPRHSTAAVSHTYITHTPYLVSNTWHCSIVCIDQYNWNCNMLHALCIPQSIKWADSERTCAETQQHLSYHTEESRWPTDTHTHTPGMNDTVQAAGSERWSPSDRVRANSNGGRPCNGRV